MLIILQGIRMLADLIKKDTLSVCNRTKSHESEAHTDSDGWSSMVSKWDDNM